MYMSFLYAKNNLWETETWIYGTAFIHRRQISRESKDIVWTPFPFRLLKWGKTVLVFPFLSHSTCEIKRTDVEGTQLFQGHEGTVFKYLMHTFRCFVLLCYLAIRIYGFIRAGTRMHTTTNAEIGSAWCKTTNFLDKLIYTHQNTK